MSSCSAKICGVLLALAAAALLCLCAGAEGGLTEDIGNLLGAILGPTGDSGSGGLPAEGDSGRHENYDLMLKSFSEVSDSDVLVDVAADPDVVIDGSSHISFMDFNDPSKDLKTVPELARMLGNAGISRDDPLVIYGECLPCGGGPSMATYVYWVMRYLGHDTVWVLKGGLKEWEEAGLPVNRTSSTRPPTTYTPRPRTGLLADYGYVRSGQAQIVDARSEQGFRQGSIPHSINIPSFRVLNGTGIGDNAVLEDVFKDLDKQRPVVVYTDTGVMASVVWFALNLSGYNASLYSWKDWTDHQRTSPERRL